MTDIDTKELRRLMEEARECGAGATTREYADYLIALDEAAPALLSEAEEAARLREELAALRAAPAAPVADGWVLVPREPTEAMNDAARDWSAEKYGKPIGKDASEGCYRAMLAAAPAAEPVADGWRPDAEKMREDCARWCETNGFSEAAPMLRKLPISLSRAAPTEAGR